jgi:predicted metalloprotease
VSAIERQVWCITLTGGTVLRRWLPILSAALLVAGCGSSSGSDKASSDPTATASPTATVTATATPVVRSPDLHRLPQAPKPNRGAPSSQGTSRNAFLRAVFDDIEALWTREFQTAGIRYRPARLTIFSQQVHTACGTQPAQVGPFYCPASFGVYLDPVFFAALSRRVGVRIGDFAQAYVVAHEVAHHVQTLLGLTHQKAIADQQDPARKNARSVRFELQADCLAGVWMHSAYQRGALSEADLHDALNAAAVVGDDFQQNAAGVRRPREDWTHGSSAQRQQWLTTGFEEGRPDSCDTFS